MLEVEGRNGSSDVYTHATEETDNRSNAEQRVLNVKLSLPLIAIREEIRELWYEVMELCETLELTTFSRENRRIVATKKTSQGIRHNIHRILAQPLPDTRQAKALIALLATVETKALAMLPLRNTFIENQQSGDCGFLDNFPDYYANALDFPTRKSLAREGVFRAAETFDPTEGTFANYAYIWIRSLIQRAAKRASKHTRTSLDGPQRLRGNSRISRTLYACISDTRGEQAHVIYERHRIIQKLEDVRRDMPEHWRIALDLTEGIGGNGKHPPKKAAEIMNTLEIRLTKKTVAITPANVRQWAKAAKLFIAKRRSLFMEEETD